MDQHNKSIFHGAPRTEPDTAGQQESSGYTRPPEANIDFHLKPEELEEYLNQYVVDQPEAVEVLATKICTHFNRMRLEIEEGAPSDATLGNNYIFGEPRDFAKALEQMQAGVALAPNEPNAHMFVGDAYRAQRNLAKARDEYSRGHELDPRDPILLVKLGHANTFLGDYTAARANYDSAEAVARAGQRGGFVPFRAFVSVYAGEPAAAIDELNRLVQAVDGMGVTDPTASKVNALTSVVTIAIHSGLRTAAEQALKQLEPLLMQQADQAGNPAFRRGQEATIAYFQGWLAAKSGDYAAAQQQADRINELLAPDANPRKLEPMHQVEGFIALYQKQYSQAADHFRHGNPFDPYVKYQLALATEGAGDVAGARKLFREVADYNFNALGFALVRRDAQQKAGAGT